MKLGITTFWRLAPLLGMVALAGVSRPALADDAAMPGGQWRQSCEDASIRNGVLYARCRQSNGQYRSTSALLLSTCAGYSNRDGQLYCDRNEASQGTSRWKGSYAQSCTNVDVDKHGRLSATCLRANGKSNRSNITLQQCPSRRAGNRDGKLVCEAQTNAARRWDGSFKQSCREIDTNAAGTLTATCQSSTGSWQRTSLAANRCNDYRAGNNNGQLVCESPVSAARRWEGSFSRSCREIDMSSSGTLTATCQTMSGNWQRTSLDARQCGSGRAGNDDGRLFCEN